MYEFNESAHTLPITCDTKNHKQVNHLFILAEHYLSLHNVLFVQTAKLATYWLPGSNFLSSLSILIILTKNEMIHCVVLTRITGVYVDS